ncbi:MAG: VWA domain-containing protein [Blastocatellia bacterium]|nr:VWA domain-containing protein [Blastocatellia bacterium]
MSPKRIIFALFFALIPFSTPAQEKAQDEPLKLQTSLVSVPVVVSDRQGRYIAGLKVEDFKLYQDGVRQEIAFFDAAEEPLNVALLLDTSKSTRQVLDDIKKAAVDFLKQLRPQDKAMVVSFDYAVHVLSPLTADRKAVERAVNKAEIGETPGTTLYDAIIEVTGRQFKPVSGRKAIILLTDGKDFGSRISADDLLDSVMESDTMIYSVFYLTGPLRNLRDRRMPFPRERRGRRGRRWPPTSDAFTSAWGPNPQRRERANRKNEEAIEFLETLAEATAGRLYHSEVTDLKKTFELIAEELRHQYLLGFYPGDAAQDGREHRLKVEVSQPGAVVRARRSYRAASSDASR